MSTVADRVAAGAAYLDEREPGWWQRIDLDRLDLQAQCRCVLGQLATDVDRSTLWETICERFGVLPFGRKNCRPSDSELGFNVLPGYEECDDDLAALAEYAQLTAEWKALINARRST